MINVEKLFNSNEISLTRFPHYIELHYQAFKSTWRRNDETTSRLCYLTWLLAYEHESPLLNFAKHDHPVVEFMLAHYKDENHRTWNISQLEFYFVENYKNEFISWGMPPLTYQTQNIYADWFKKNENFKRYFPYERKHIDPKTLFLTSSTVQDTGIDIIGFPLSPTGLGELTRSLISASVQLELNINVVNLDQHASKNNYPNIAHFISDQPKNKIRIFATPLQNVPVLLYTRGIDYFKDSFNILNTAWEFEQRTNNLDSAFLILNEVWTLSHFIKPGFKNPESVPVKVLHCGVHDTQKIPSNRKKWNLPEETFLFLSAFDFNSYLKRKNPQLAIDSFIKAFAEKSNTALVIKCTNVDETSAEWIELVSIIQNHNNIYLINKTLGRDELIELLQSVDAFISLHRSEGFGYIIAESMKIGIPVICTGYSGNMDFCNSENSYLVDFELVGVKDGEYIQSEGLVWANPKIESAIQQMKLVLEDKNLRTQKVAAARKKINTEFSISAISQQLELHLTSLCEKENIEYKSLKRISS